MNVGALVLGNLIGGAIGTLLMALIVRFLTRKIVGFRPRYWGIYLALLVSYIGMYSVGFFLGASGALGPDGTDPAGTLILVVVSFFVQAGFMVLFFKGDEGQSITYGQALLVTLAQIVIGFMLIAAILMLVVVFRS